MEQMNSETSVMTMEYLNEFPSAAPTFWEANSFFVLFKSSVPNTKVPRDTATLLLVAATIIQYRGKTESMETTVKKPYARNFFPLVTFITYLHLQKCQNCYQEQD